MASLSADTAPALTAADRALLGRVKAAVRAAEPDAEVVLYGSRARGDARPDSDWDLLVLVSGTVDLAREQSARRRLLDIELDTAQVLTLIMHERRDWHEGFYRITPLYTNIRDEGLAL